MGQGAPLVLGSAASPFEATHQPSSGPPKAEDLRPNPLTGIRRLSRWRSRAPTATPGRGRATRRCLAIPSDLPSQPTTATATTTTTRHPLTVRPTPSPTAALHAIPTSTRAPAFFTADARCTCCSPSKKAWSTCCCVHATP